jgi:hypothetical protein
LDRFAGSGLCMDYNILPYSSKALFRNRTFGR